MLILKKDHNASFATSVITRQMSELKRENAELKKQLSELKRETAELKKPLSQRRVSVFRKRSVLQMCFPTSNV